MIERPHVKLDAQYSLSETAELLGRDRKTIYRWRKLGYLKTKTYRHNKRPFVLGREILRVFEICD